jgi:hypothetical protein
MKKCGKYSAKKSALYSKKILSRNVGIKAGELEERLEWGLYC